MAFEGLDVEAVEELARQLHAQSERLGSISGAVNLLVDHSGHVWQGPSAEQFAGDWHQHYRPSLLGAMEALQGLSVSAANNAHDQRTASGGAPAGPVYAVSPLGSDWSPERRRWFYAQESAWESGKAKLPYWMQQQYPDLGWAVSTGHDQAIAMEGKSAADQQQWWASLTPSQQQTMTVAYPGLLLALSGLTPSTLDKARQAYYLEEQGSVVARVDDQSATIKADLGLVKVSDKISATTTTYGDGHTEVTVEGDRDIAGEWGRGTAKVGLGREDGIAATYTFQNAAQAQAFLQGLKHNPLNAVSYLNGYSPELTSVVAHVQIQADAGITLGGAKLDIATDRGAQYDFKSGTTTVYADLSADASLGANSANISGHVAMQVDNHGHVISATVSGSAHVAAGVDPKLVVSTMTGTGIKDVADFGVEGTRGAEVNFSASVDPNDPVMQAHLLQLIEHPASTAALSQLLNSSDASLSIASTSSTSATAEVLGSGVDTKTSSSVTTLSYDKPANGSWVNVTPKQGSGSW
jgi:hypothetical protein